jgi:Zn finger protein HypA/HybF involved in hydrogenase expression
MYALALVLGLLGLAFLVGYQGQVGRLFLGVVLLVTAFVVFWLGRAKAPERTIVQKIDLTGDVSREQLKCKNCSAALDEKSVEMHEGAILVKCPYCGTSYQLQEAPKW